MPIDGRRVVITGVGVVTPLGLDVDTFWPALIDGNCGVHPLTTLDASQYKVSFGADIPEFDLGNLVPAKDSKKLDRFTQFAMQAGTEAIRDSGLDLDALDRTRCGVILGSGIGGLAEIESQIDRLMTKGPSKVSPFTIPKMMVNAAGGNLAIHYGLRGPNYAVATACASASNAMGDARRSIQIGECDVVITGGTEAAITKMGLAAFQNMKALSTRNEDPAKASRPFDADRDGFVLGEGAGLLVFEERERAMARGAKIYAEVIGYGTTCDAGHITAPDPEGVGAAAAMQAAIEDAGIEPGEIDYINAHGTSTPLGDQAESKAIMQVLGDAAMNTAVSSTKGALGHSLGASGGIEAVILCKSIDDSVVPPTINYETPDPGCPLDYVPNEKRPMDVGIAMSNSFGFGGHNACIILRKHSATE